MACDIQVVVQAVIYFVIFILNFAVAIPLGVTMIELGNQCMLYGDITWKDSNHFTFILSSQDKCNFQIYVSVVLIFYALIVGIYYMYKACRSRDPNVGFEMWVLPFIIINILVTIVMFIVCCMISVGLKTSCDNFLKGQSSGSWITKCADIEEFTWQQSSVKSGKHFYQYPKISEIAGWITFFMWVAQLTLCIVRFVRNLRKRSQDKSVTSSNAISTGISADVNKFASCEPTA